MKLKFERIQGNEELSVSIINGENTITFNYVTLIKSLYNDANDFETVFGATVTDDEKEKISAMIQDICRVMVEPLTEEENSN